MTRLLLCGFGLFVALSTAACSEGFVPQSEIRQVRVLGVQVQPPEWAPLPPGEGPAPLQLTALAVAPTSTPTVRFALCRPGNPFALDFQCPGQDGVDLPGGVLPFDFPALQAQLAAVTGGSSAFDDPAVQALLAEGFPVVVGYEAEDGSDSPEGRERGVRRLTLRVSEDPNQNPVVEELLGGELPLTGPLIAGSEITLRPVLNPNSLQSFSTPDGSRTEAVFYSFHATGEGEVKQFRSIEAVNGEAGDPTSDYVAPETSQPVTFYVVARDGRGGEGWIVRTVQVVPQP